MASVATICNMALGHIGSDARVSSIDPPDGSVEADHCQRYYAQTRTELLEPGNWAFSLKRRQLAELDNESTTWAYAYQVPSDCLRALRIIGAATALDFTIEDLNESAPAFDDNDGADYQIEGTTLFTNVGEAVLVYVRDITDTTKFSPSFVTALSFALAAHLAGPIIKGMEGARMAAAMRQEAERIAAISATASANASQDTKPYLPSSIAARR